LPIFAINENKNPTTEKTYEKAGLEDRIMTEAERIEQARDAIKADFAANLIDYEEAIWREICLDQYECGVISLDLMNEKFINWNELE
jgi:hypothetical protein